MSAIQEIIDRAVKIATHAAYNGYPAERITWVPATSATQDAGGTFTVEYYGPRKATDDPI